MSDENPVPSNAPAVVDKPTRAPIPAGIVLQTAEDYSRLAVALAKSSIVPTWYRGKPDDAFVALLLAAELGIPPATALTSIMVVNGRAALYGDALLAVVMASTHYSDHDESYLVDGRRADVLTFEDLKHDATSALCTFVRRGKATPVTRGFSVGDAKLAKLWGKEGPWREFPSRMLRMRARAFAARDAFPDVLRGIRTDDEVADFETPTTPRIVRRVSEQPSVPRETTPRVSILAGVALVEAFSGRVTLTTGDVVLAEPADLTELAKFSGSDHKLTFTARRDGDALRVVAFAIAD
jgi:hypothetical protein